MTDVWQLWTYLSEGPLVWLTATLIAYLIADQISHATGRSALANPVLIAVALLAVVLSVTATPYETYFEGAQFVHFLLGPATVALAAPLHANLGRVRESILPMVAALLAGSVTAILVAVGVGVALGLDHAVLMSLAPKSATAPVAMGVSEQLGAAPALTAIMVLMTGVSGAILATPLLGLMRIRSDRARGFALGVTAHGIGTARAFQLNETAGVFSGIGMGLNAILTAILAPLILVLF